MAAGTHDDLLRLARDVVEAAEALVLLERHAHPPGIAAGATEVFHGLIYTRCEEIISRLPDSVAAFRERRTAGLQ